MARNRYIKTHSNYVIKESHKLTNIGAVYERDFMTIADLNTYSPENVPAYSLNGFKMAVNNTISRKKKHHYAKWLKNDACGKNNFYWSLDCVDNNGVAIVNNRQVKPNRQNILSFACYGSAGKLVEATIAEVVNKFPGEVVFTDVKVELDGRTYYMVSNPFNIEFDKYISLGSDSGNSLRVFSESVSEYVFTTGDGAVSNKLSWELTLSTQFNLCDNEGKILSRIDLGKPFNNGGTILLYYCIIHGKKVLLHDGLYMNATIRPKQCHITSFFDNLSDFAATLLNKRTGYTALLETPYETDRGNRMVKRSYRWPKSEYGTWNIDVTDSAYLDYVESLMKIADFYDEYFANNIWRSMTHEAIINFDWCHVTVDANGTTSEEREPNSGHIKAFIHVAGRQFDDLKMYIDGIKSANAITYDENSNKLDRFLINELENNGWEIISPLSINLKRYPSHRLYPSHVDGYTLEEANYEFLRRLSLNAGAIMRAKGTKRAIEMVMAMFGYYSTNFIEHTYHEVYRNGILKNVYWDDLTDEEQKAIKRYSYDITEYVYVANSESGIWGASKEECEENVELVKSFNKEKYTFRDNNEDAYQGLPVKEVTVATKETAIPYIDSDGSLQYKYYPSYYSYLIPWFDKKAKYDGDTNNSKNFYFESKGGWGLKQTLVTELNETNERVIDTTDNFKIYDETINYLRFVDNLESLVNFYGEVPKEGIIYYVYDISEDEQQYDWGDVSIKITEDGVEKQKTEGVRTLSHYFVLEDRTYDYILGVRRDENDNVMLVDENASYDENNLVINYETVDENGFPCKKYGWRNISEEEINAGVSDDAKKVYYIESIIEQNTGNNPHCGYGNYDYGETYVNNLRDIFKGAKDRKLFESLSDDEMPEGFGFEFDEMIDNVKCWFFTDTFGNTNFLKKVSFDENGYAELEEDNEESVVGYGNFLRLNNNRETNLSNDLFSSSQYENMTPYNMEDETNENDEAAANSIVNNKHLFIEFAKDMHSPESTFDFIENTVMFYAKQVIPSTTLLKYYVHMRDSEVNCYHRTYLQSAIIN
jgi:hypothetical protein